MSLAVDIEKRLGDFSLTARFATSPGVTSLFGRSGAGKTTLVQLIAGLLRPDRGRIDLNGSVLADSETRTFVPAHRRRIGYVFQESRLFPHLSVRQNLLYGRHLAPRTERWSSFGGVVNLLGIGSLLSRRPGALSGGEARRVAIGRALLASPRLLLLDEPLSGLDEARRAEILPYLERLRDEMRLPIVHVSHDLEEVIRFADTLVLVAEGRVVASGSVAEVFSRPDFAHHAGRIEPSSVITATVESHDPGLGVTRIAHPAGRLTLPAIERPVGAKVRLMLRARDVSVAIGEIGRISIRNRLHVTVSEVAPREAPSVDVWLDTGREQILARLTAEAVAELRLAPGVPVTALIKSAAFERG